MGLTPDWFNTAFTGINLYLEVDVYSTFFHFSFKNIRTNGVDNQIKLCISPKMGIRFSLSISRGKKLIQINISLNKFYKPLKKQILGELSLKSCFLGIGSLL
jgi:hypothetical protein